MTNKTACDSEVITNHLEIASESFVFLNELCRVIFTGTEWNKKAQIILEYDPQKEKMLVTTAMNRKEAPQLHERIREFYKPDGEFIAEKKFSKELMEKSGLIRYVYPTGGTRISIEYDADTSEGRLTAYTDQSIQTDLTDSQ